MAPISRNYSSIAVLLSIILCFLLTPKGLVAELNCAGPNMFPPDIKTATSCYPGSCYAVKLPRLCCCFPSVSLLHNLQVHLVHRDMKAPALIVCMLRDDFLQTTAALIDEWRRRRRMRRKRRNSGEEEEEAAHLEGSSLENQLICLTSVLPDSRQVASSCGVCHHFLSAESSRL